MSSKPSKALFKIEKLSELIAAFKYLSFGQNTYLSRSHGKRLNKIKIGSSLLPKGISCISKWVLSSKDQRCQHSSMRIVHAEEVTLLTTPNTSSICGTKEQENLNILIVSFWLCYFNIDSFVGVHVANHNCVQPGSHLEPLRKTKYYSEALTW